MLNLSAVRIVGASQHTTRALNGWTRVLSNWVCAALVLLSIGSFAGQAVAQIGPTEIVGGPGGAAFTDQCPDGEFLTGINYVDGQSVGLAAIAAVCTPFAGNRPTGTEHALRIWGNPNVDRRADYYVKCPLSMAAQDVSVRVANDNFVRQFALICRAIDAHDYKSTTYAEVNVGIAYAKNVGCGGGALAIGIVGRYGTQVDGLGLLCKTMANASPPPPQETTTAKPQASDYAGVWESTIFDVNAKFRIIMRADGDKITADLINEQDTRDNGILTGTVSAKTGTLMYTYTEPQVGGSGAGYFIIRPDGTLLGYTHYTNSSQAMKWGGVRTGDAPPQDTTAQPPITNDGNGDNGTNGATAANDTTIYDQPEGNDVAYLQAGDPVTITSCNGDGWCKISKPRKGWVWGEDLKK